VAVLLISWFLGLSFSRGPSPDIARQIQRSAVMHTLDSFAPRPPAFLASVENILSGVNFPSAFAGLEPPSLPNPLPIPAAVDTASVTRAANAVVRVSSLGCGGLVTGSGFPIGDGYVVTNAHVVSGTSAHVIWTPTGTQLKATVVLFDPRRDVAVLYVPEYRVPALTFAAAAAARGTTGAVIGYPGGGPEAVAPAAVDGEIVAESRDIYNNPDTFTRGIYVIQARVRPGNSGGPLIDLQGHVLGVVFATSAADPTQAYALTAAEVAPDISEAQAHPSPKDTSQFSCAA
jgi:S1-C subfamily serine protease